MTLGVGIIGLGFGAKVHLAGYQSLPDVAVRAVASRRLKHAQVVARQADIPLATDDWRVLIADPNIDILSIATPPALHHEIVMTGINAGKHILCEKPFGLSSAQALDMQQALEQADKLQGAVGLEFRMEPGITALHDLVQSGQLGDLLRIDVTWLTSGRADPERPWGWQHDHSQGGGVIAAYASHPLDYIMWITAAAFEWVWAHSRILISDRPAATEWMPVTAEDEADIIGRLSNGAMASITVSNGYPNASQHRIELHGKLGSAMYITRFPYNLQHTTLTFQQGNERTQIPLTPLDAVPNAPSLTASFRKMAQQFIHTIQTSAIVGSYARFNDGVRLRQVLDAAVESNRTDMMITLQSVASSF